MTRTIAGILLLAATTAFGADESHYTYVSADRIVLQPRLVLRASSASDDQAAVEVRLRY